MLIISPAVDTMSRSADGRRRLISQDTLSKECGKLMAISAIIAKRIRRIAVTRGQLISMGIFSILLSKNLWQRVFNFNSIYMGLTVDRPILSYSGTVWVRTLDNKNNLKKLERVQALALRIMTGAFPSTPFNSLNHLTE